MSELSIDEMSAHVERIVRSKIRFPRPRYAGAVITVPLTRGQIEDLIIAGYVAGWAGEQASENAEP